METLSSYEDNFSCLSELDLIDLGEIITVKGVKLRHRNVNQTGVVKDFRIYGRPQFFLFKALAK